MSVWRSLISTSLRARPLLNTRIRNPMRISKLGSHDEGPVQPFDNMPFSIPNRFAATVFFSFFFGLGLWAPFVIVWYSMAKRTL